MMTEQDTYRPETAREEAERLVAAGLAALSVAADRIGAPSRQRGGAAAAGYDALGDVLFGPTSHRGHSVANDSTECCRCPVCRAISAARNPQPEFAERLATGVGNVAEGAARLLQGLAGDPLAGPVRRAASSPASGSTPRPPERPPEPSPERGPDGDPDPWAAATA